jgi:hypothetical protein
MATLLKLKRSAVANKIPQPEDLDFGEIAINYQDGIIYYKKPNGTVAALGGGGSGGAVGRSITEFSATTGQTTFTIAGGYTVGFVDVILNGSQLASSDYVATNGTSVVLQQACVAGDLVRIVSYDAVSLANTYRKAEVDSLVNETAIVMAIALG